MPLKYPTEKRLDLDALKQHERAEIECLLAERPGVSQLTQSAAPLPTLDQLRDYETFENFNACNRRDGLRKKVGIFKTVVHVMQVYFCGCMTSRKQGRRVMSESHRGTPSLFDKSSGCSGGGGRVRVGQRRMGNHGFMIERNFPDPGSAELSMRSLIPIGVSTRIAGSDSPGSKIIIAGDGDMSSRWVHHPAYELDMEGPGDYSYLGEGSAQDATRVWRGHVRSAVFFFQ